MLIGWMVAMAASGACAAGTPVALAEALQAKAYEFYVDADLARPYVSDALHAALVRDAECQTDGQCAISADPWLDAQDGEIVGKVVGREVSKTATNADVSLCFDVAMGEEKAQQCAQILAVKNAAGCWVADDLVAASGTSLRKIFAEYPYE